MTDTVQVSDTEPSAVAENTTPVNPAKRAAIIIVAILASLLVWYALADRFAPSTSRGEVSANVLQVSPRVPGRVVSVNVIDNQQVKAGDVLYSIDDQPFQLAVDGAKERLKEAAQGVDASTAQLAASEAQVAQARVELERVQNNTDRIRSLAARGLLAQSDLDQANTNLSGAKEALKSAIAASDSANKALGVQGENNPRIKAAQAALQSAEYDLLSTVVKAPRDGVVTNLHLAPGQFVSAGGPSLTFIEGDAHWIVAEFRENQLGLINEGDSAGVIFDAMPGHVFKAKVASVGWGISTGERQSQGLMVNRPANQWFEPARRMPVRIELEGNIGNWPEQARVGGKINVIVYSAGGSNPVAWIGALVHRVQSWLTVFY